MTVQWTWQTDLGPERVDEKTLDRLNRLIDPILDENAQRYVEFLSDLLQEPTISGATDRAGQRRYREAMDTCLARVEQQAIESGLTWRDHEGIAAVAEWPGSRGQEGSIGIATHLDVVPPGGTWQHPPFGGDVINGEIWGRGAQDDKGAVAMALAAMDVLKRLGLEPKSDIRLLMGTLEETNDWPDMDLLLEREEPPEFTLVPDGAFPVVVAEKGIITTEWHGNWAPAPHDLYRFVGLSGGERHNMVPAKATLWIACRREDEADTRHRLEAIPTAAVTRSARDPPTAAGDDICFEVVFKGKAAHGAFPRHGHNAVLDALKALDGLLDGRGAGAFARFLLATCSADDASGIDIDRADPQLGNTTLNLGTAQMGTTSGHVQVNIRFPFGLRLDDVKNGLRRATRNTGEGLHVEYMTRGRPHEPLFVSPEDHPRLIHSLQAAYHTGTGREAKLASLAGTTYAKIFPLALPFGPQDESAGEPILAHQCDERITITRHMENIRVYVLALALLAFDEQKLEKRVNG